MGYVRKEVIVLQGDDATDGFKRVQVRTLKQSLALYAFLI